MAHGDAAASRGAVGEEARLYRLRSATDAAWPGTVAYKRRDSVWRGIGAFFSAIARLFLPVLMLVSAFAAIYLYLDTKLPLLSDESWLTVSHAIVPVSFFVIALTNRRYGASYAFAQVALSFAAVLGVVFFMPGAFAGLLSPAIEPTARVAGAFGVSYFLASFLSIIMFDGARGPRWWTAPLLGLLSASLVFAAIFYPAAYGGTHVPWAHEMVVYGWLTLVAAVIALVPYWLLRAMVPPLSGFGGY